MPPFSQTHLLHPSSYSFFCHSHCPALQQHFIAAAMFLFSIMVTLTANQIPVIHHPTRRFKTCEMWVLNDDGTLMNSYSGLCATLGLMKEMVTTSGVRSWIATGRRGEIYLSFFNLNPTRTQISTRMGYLAKVLDRNLLRRGSCKCYEVWSGKNFGIVKHTLSTMVEAHGCALFVLDCS